MVKSSLPTLSLDSFFNYGCNRFRYLLKTGVVTFYDSALVLLHSFFPLAHNIIVALLVVRPRTLDHVWEFFPLWPLLLFQPFAP